MEWLRLGRTIGVSNSIKQVSGGSRERVQGVFVANATSSLALERERL